MLTSGIETSDLKETYLKLFLDKKEILFSGSEIMNELREKALTAFSEKGLPAVKAENYKYTNISAAFGTSLRYISDHSTVELQSKDLSALHIPELDAYSLIVVNGFYADTKNSLVKLPNGIIYGSLKAASIQYPEIFRNHYGHYADFSNDGITALNTAFAIDGCFIYVPEKVTGEKPFRIIHMVNSSEPVMVQYRSLVILEKNASANIVISDTDLSISGFLANSVMEIFSGENSGLSLIRLQNEHDNSTHVTGTFIHQSGDSRVNTNYIILNGGLIRNNLLVNRKLGAGLRLATVLTDLPLIADKPVEDSCGECRRCMALCPAKAIKERPEDFDHQGCFAKLKEFQKLRYTDQYICGVCIKACAGSRR
jgi:Fe-S cluster assembly protein SufD